jgi:hypothetical protein
MADQFTVTQEEAGELRKAINQAIMLLQFVGDRLGRPTPSQELAADYTKELDTRPVVNVKGLRNKIKKLLQDSGSTPRRSVDLADALYTPSMGITRDRFTRRVIVNISAMYKEGTHGIEKVAMEGRDALWRFKHNDFHNSEADNPDPLKASDSTHLTITAPSKANSPL